MQGIIAMKRFSTSGNSPGHWFSRMPGLIFMTIVWFFIHPGIATGTTSGPLILTDAADQTVVLKTPPERIVVIGRGPFMAVHTLYMFPEARDRLVGFENRSTEIKNFLALLDPKSHEIMELGTNPGVEQILSLRPDLVIKKAYSVDKMAALLLQAGIPVLHVGLETPERFFDDLRNIGRVLENPQRAEAIIAFYRVRLDRFTQRVEPIPDDRKPRVLILHLDGRSSASAMRIPPENWMQTIQTKFAGGHPVWLDAHPNPSGWNFVNFEQIAAWDADQIFIITQQSADTGTILTELRNNSLWKQLKAVQSGNLMAFPSDLIGWDSPEPRWILGMTWMALQIHPDIFGDIRMKDEIYAFFTFLYGLDKRVIDSGIRPGITLHTRDNP
jgi:iron complex transport system substrate-binding protein